MDIMKAIKENDLYRQSLQGLSDDEIKHVESELEILTAPLRELMTHIRALAVDDDGFLKMSDALDSVMTMEEVKKWHEKS
tara:strand:- start:43 stop:282 length:240 start_codon:yes stop_codon:yes gene_type:complete